MRIAFIAALALSAAVAAHADPVEGTWRTENQENGGYGHVRIAPCGPAFCGVLARTFGAAGQEVQAPELGRRILWDMTAQGGGRYEGGQVWSPDRDKTYVGKLQLEGDRLLVFGCILGVCRQGATWARVR